MSKETLKHIIDMIDEKDTETIYNVLVRFIPEDTPLPDEVEAIKLADREIANGETISHNDIDWD